MTAQNFIELLDVQLQQAAISLDSMGVENLAWRKGDALKVVEALKYSDWAVLGGDVVRKADILEYTYDNWSCDPLPNEIQQAYVVRSHDEAASYIRGYKIQEGFQILFALVAGRVV
jgi:hypothetical protein